MLLNTIGNASFTGISIPSGQNPVNIQTQVTTSETISVINTPIVGTTVVAKPGIPTVLGTATLFNSVFDPNGNLITLSLNDNDFFQGLTFYSNLYPGGTWTGTTQVYVGTAAYPPTTLLNTLNGNDANLSPITFPSSPTAKAQVAQYYPTASSLLPDPFAPNAFTDPIPNQLYKFTSAVAPNNYLTVAYPYGGAGTLSFPSPLTGTFKIFLTYMTVN